MDEKKDILSPAPWGLSSTDIEGFDGVAHVRIEGEISFAGIDDAGPQHTWAWTKQATVPIGHQEVASFWQVVRFWVEEQGCSKEEMADFLESTANLLRREVESD